MRGGWDGGNAGGRAAGVVCFSVHARAVPLQAAVPPCIPGLDRRCVRIKNRALLDRLEPEQRQQCEQNKSLMSRRLRGRMLACASW
jgi:hypothetical protein